MVFTGWFCASMGLDGSLPYCIGTGRFLVDHDADPADCLHNYRLEPDIVRPQEIR